MTTAPLAAATARARPARSKPLAWLVPAVIAGALVPYVVIIVRAIRGELGANPIATALNQLGLLALILLVCCLACTPIKIVTGQNWPIRIRRTLGLLAFFTALAHFLVYLVLDQTLALGRVLSDVVKRPFIAFGFIALLLLVPLAATSSKRALQRLGFKRWKLLHRLIYVVGVLAIVHFLLRVKADTSEPLVYGTVLAILLATRLVDAVRTSRKARRSAA
jgi:methionine sulfoxide reductase heme-binding subunit